MFPLAMNMAEEPDDPKRAQTLVNGLEEVPAGLVKRMERAGGPGISRGDVPNCAVCWESLLEPEGGGFEGNAQLARDEADAEAAREDEASRNRTRPSNDGDDSGPVPLPAATSSSSSSSTTDPSGDRQHPKIVVLPCAHAFHATCLLPWFSKPGRTTCPSCRFDIDPDSLTYRRRLYRARAPHPQAGPQAGPPSIFENIFGLPLPRPTDAAPHPVVPAQTAEPAPVLAPVNVPDNPADAPAAHASAQPVPAEGTDAQRRQQPLPPFLTFDARMIVPIFPGRGPGGDGDYARWVGWRWRGCRAYHRRLRRAQGSQEARHAAPHRRPGY